MNVFGQIASFIFGAIIGSFLNVCAYRLPREESIIRPGSHCPKCKAPIRWYDNIPILSFIFLRGRCRYCQERISWRYPLVELASALLSLILYQKFSLSLAYLLFLAFVSALLVASLIDLDFQIIPDEISLPGILVGWAFSFWNPLIGPFESFLGALAGAGGLYLVGEFYYFLTEREGLGGGDLKLLAFIGSFLGLRSLIPIIFISSLVGAVIGITLGIIQKVQNKRFLAIPYGPFLSLGALIYLFYPHLLDFLFGILFD